MTFPRIEWNPDYDLGVEDIDFQHHYFLNLINRLAAELNRTDNLDYRVALIAELNAYARFHFLSEENMMGRAGYPQLAEHKEHHLKLIDQLSHRQALLTISHSSEDAEAILAFLVDWFLKHTVQEDRLFAAYLQGER